MISPAVEMAYKLIHAGLSIIPIAPNGTKKPTIKWKIFETRFPTAAEVAYWFQPGRVGIAIVAGAISGNLEILDFDDGDVFDPWQNLITALFPLLMPLFPVVQSPSGGFHVYYRCQTIAGNQKLARWQDAQGRPGKVRIETRGEGGYALTPYSPPACHRLNRCYRMLQGNLCEPPTVTEAARATLLDASRAFDESYERPLPHYPSRISTGAVSRERPGDRFAATHQWEDILVPHGWRPLRTGRDGVTSWVRPGKALGEGISATTGHDGYDVLYIFSTNALPFEPLRGYSKFSAYAWLNFRGDFSAAARALRVQEKSHA